MDISYNGLTIKRIPVNTTTETLLVTLESGHHFPKHESPQPALLIVMEGIISFDLEDETQQILHPFESYQIPARLPHTVVALSNARFIIIR